MGSLDFENAMLKFEGSDFVFVVRRDPHIRRLYTGIPLYYGCFVVVELCSLSFSKFGNLCSK